MKGPGPFRVSSRPAALRAAVRVLKSPAAAAVSTMIHLEPADWPADPELTVVMTILPAAKVLLGMLW